MADSSIDHNIVLGNMTDSVYNLNELLSPLNDDADEFENSQPSLYYAPDKLSSTSQHNTTSFSVLSLNIQSIRAKIDSIPVKNPIHLQGRLKPDASSGAVIIRSRE